MIARSEQHIGFGLSLDELVYIRTSSDESDGPMGSLVPPAALVPRLRGEKVRVDDAWPTHPRGSGSNWPPEAVVDGSRGFGRMPLSLAWANLEDDADWCWTDSEQQEHAIRPSQAIVAGVKTVCQRRRTTTAGPPALVIPNELSQSAQQALLDAARSEKVEFKLLWRPVAAAIEWCDRNLYLLDEGHIEQDVAMGDLIVIHLGLDVCESTVLEVVDHRDGSRNYMLPARKRPSLSCDSIVSPGCDLFYHLADRVLNSNDIAPQLNDLWHLLWCSTWLHGIRGQLCGGDNTDTLPPIQSRWDFRPSSAMPIDHWRSAIDSLTRSHDALVPDLALPGYFDKDAFSSWRNRLRVRIGDARPLGVVVTGPLAAMPWTEKRTFGEFILQNAGISRKDVVIEGVDVSDGVLANGAASYSHRLAADLPTYLDSLPELATPLKTAVVPEGGGPEIVEPRWIDLHTDSRKLKYVLGGRPWDRKETISLEIASGREHLDIPLFLGGVEHVRSAHVEIGELPKEDIPVQLHVSIEPAGGNARLEVREEEPQYLPRGRIKVNWKTMTDRFEVVNEKGDVREKQLTKEQWVKSQPQIFPPLMKRAGSRYMWGATEYWNQGAQSPINAYLRRPTEIDLLENAKTKLRQKDTFHKPPDDHEQSRTPIGSEGLPPDYQDVVSKFVRHLVRKLPPFTKGNKNSGVLQALAATSTDDEEFQDWLCKAVVHSGPFLSRDVLSACGWCLRNAKHIGVFSVAMLEYFQRDGEGPNNWLKAMSEILRYRTHAAQYIEVSVAEGLTREMLKVFQAERKRQNAQHKFRNASLGITYLLRKRWYKNGESYLSPASDLAVLVKNEFDKAITEYNQLDAMGGAIDLKLALQTMIDYIDKRGPSVLGGRGALQGLTV